MPSHYLHRARASRPSAKPRIWATDMPRSHTHKVLLPLPHLYLPKPPLPYTRRISEADRREEYRRAKFGELGPVDAWLAAHMSPTATAAAGPDAPLGPDEVCCVVYVQRIQVSARARACPSPPAAPTRALSLSISEATVLTLALAPSLRELYWH